MCSRIRIVFGSWLSYVPSSHPRSEGFTLSEVANRFTRRVSLKQGWLRGQVIRAVAEEEHQGLV